MQAVTFGRTWTDGENIYYSSGSDQYVLDKATSTWQEKTWNGNTDFTGSYVWTDGENIYYSNGSVQYVLINPAKTYPQIGEKYGAGKTSESGGGEGGASTRIFYTDSDLRALNLGATQYVGINYNASPDDPPKAGDYVKDPYGVFAVLDEDFDTATDMAQVACVATVSEDEGSTNVFKITYSLQTTVGKNTGIDDAMISPSANLIKKGDIAVDPNNTVGLFQTDYDESGIQIVKTICSATGASGKTYTHNITIDCGNNGFVTAQVLSTDSTAFATVADFISFLSENGLKVNAKTPLSASGFYIQTAGSAEVTYPIVGIGQYGNRTDGVGIYYFRTDVSAGRSGYQIIMTTNIDAFTDTVTEA